MRFAAFIPPQANQHPVPVVWYLSGLTCTEENFTVKAGAQRIAAELGLLLVAPDTSPRGDGVPGDPAGSYDFGLGAGFYVDATQEPWSRNYRMASYVERELPALIKSELPADIARQSIMGHSMGGHGALTIALRNQDRYASARQTKFHLKIIRSGDYAGLRRAASANSEPLRHSYLVERRDSKLSQFFLCPQLASTACTAPAR